MKKEPSSQNKAYWDDDRYPICKTCEKKAIGWCYDPNCYGAVCYQCAHEQHPFEKVKFE